MPAPRNTSRRRLLCAEPLEGRRLFSAPAVVPAPSSPPTDPGGASTGAANQLPDALLATLRARFGQVTILSAEFTTDDGDREWDVTAESPELSIDATLSPAGTLREAETLHRAAPPANPEPAPTQTPTAAPLAIQSPGAMAAPVAAAPTADQVEVVDMKPVDLADIDRPLSPRRLPAPVAAAMAALFPGAVVRQAEFSNDGDGPEVGIHGQFEGRPVDVAFTPDGRLKETQDALTADELPEAVRDWVRSQFPAATISDAAAITAAGVVSYEMQVNPPGAQPVEVTLRLPSAPSPDGPSVDAGGDSSGRGHSTPGAKAAVESALLPQSRLLPGKAGPARAPTDANGPSAPDRPASAGKAEPAADGGTRAADGTGEEPAGPLSVLAPRAAAREGIELIRAAARTALASAAERLRGVVASVASRQAAAALAAVPPAVVAGDAVRFERALEQWLGKIGAGAGSQGARAETPVNVAARVTAAAALVAAAHLVLVDFRKRRGTPGLAFDLSAGAPPAGRPRPYARRMARRRSSN